MMLLTVQGKYCMNGAASLFTCFGLKLIKIVGQEMKWDDLQKLLPTIMGAAFLLYKQYEKADTNNFFFFVINRPYRSNKN